MSIKSIIPQTVYTSLAPFNPIPRRIDRLRSFFKANSANKEKTPKQKGYEEHVKNEVMVKEDDKSIVDKLIKKSNRRIISIDAFSLIPQFFKNSIEVEESRVIFIYKQPFTFQSHSVDIKDISNVFIESAFLFAKMQIVSRTFIQNNITIGYLNKTKADTVRMVIEGLRTFDAAKIDTSIYTVDELMQKLEELHRTR
jgi:hypothetical protein